MDDNLKELTYETMFKLFKFIILLFLLTLLVGFLYFFVSEYFYNILLNLMLTKEGQINSTNQSIIWISILKSCELSITFTICILMIMRQSILHNSRFAIFEIIKVFYNFLLVTFFINVFFLIIGASILDNTPVYLSFNKEINSSLVPNMIIFYYLILSPILFISLSIFYYKKYKRKFEFVIN